MMDFIKRLFCKHEYTWQRKIEKFCALNGYEECLRCPKCGKIKETRWISY